MRTKQLNLIRSGIVEKLRDFLEPWVPDPDSIDYITEQTNMLTDLGLDSVAILQLMLEIEKEFNVTIKDHELDSDVFSKMANLIDIIEGKLNETD